jgi:hypothetical protein
VVDEIELIYLARYKKYSMFYVLVKIRELIRDFAEVEEANLKAALAPGSN